MISGNVIGAVLKTPDTVILVDDERDEHTMSVVGEEATIDAAVEDVRLGKTVALGRGVEIGTNAMENCTSFTGAVLIQDGEPYKITNLTANDGYDYTAFQAVICDYTGLEANSTDVSMVCMLDHVYAVGIAEPVSEIVKDHENKTIDLGLINNTGVAQLIRYFAYKEAQA